MFEVTDRSHYTSLDKCANMGGGAKMMSCCEGV